jgi:hypothetical protein
MTMTAIMLMAVLAQAPDVGGMYDVDTGGTSQKVKAGDKGQVVIEIRTKTGAHISNEAPLKIELKGTGATLEKDKLVYKDSVGQKRNGAEYPDPRFEVPFSAPAAGKASIEAKMKFFVCTEKVCQPQQKTITLPIDVI